MKARSIQCVVEKAANNPDRELKTKEPDLALLPQLLQMEKALKGILAEGTA